MIGHDKARPGLISRRGVARLTKRSGLAEVLISGCACARAREQELVSKTRDEKKPRPKSGLRVTYFMYFTLKAIIASFNLARFAVSSLPRDSAVLQRVTMSPNVFST